MKGCLWDVAKVLLVFVLMTGASLGMIWYGLHLLLVE